MSGLHLACGIVNSGCTANPVNQNGTVWKNINLRHDDKLIARKVELLDRLAENDL